MKLRQIIKEGMKLLAKKKVDEPKKEDPITEIEEMLTSGKVGT